MRLAVTATVALTLAAPALAAPAPGRVKVAVTEVKNVQGVAPGTATILSDIIVSEVATAGYAVISQSDIDAMLGFERKKQMLGCADETSCLAEIGGALGVEYLFTGQVGKIGSRFRISLLVVDARRAAVVARAAQFTDDDEDALAKGAEKLVEKLVDDLAAIRRASAAQAQAQLLQQQAASPPAPPSSPPEPVGAPAKAAPPKGAPGSAKADLVPRPPPPAAASSVAPSPAGGPVGTPAKKGRTLAWWLVGGGGGAILLGAGLGIQAKAELAKLEDQWRLSPAQYQDEYDKRSSAARTFAVAADVLMVAGLGSAGWGTWMLLRKEPAEVAVTPVPMAGGAALVASGRF